MQTTIIGDTNQCVAVQMTSGDEITADVGTLVLLSDGITLEAATHGPGTAGAPHLAVNARVPLTHFRSIASLGVVTFAAPCAGEVRKVEVQGGTWLCARDSLLFCSHEVVTTVGMVHGIANGCFRDDNCILYRLGGHGTAYIHCGGSAIEYDLAPGQRVSVDAGCVAAYQDTVEATIEKVQGLTCSQGRPHALDLITLTGPGKIHLATLPPSRIAQMARHLK